MVLDASKTAISTYFNIYLEMPEQATDYSFSGITIITFLFF